MPNYSIKLTRAQIAKLKRRAAEKGRTPEEHIAHLIDRDLAKWVECFRTSICWPVDLYELMAERYGVGSMGNGIRRATYLQLVKISPDVSPFVAWRVVRKEWTRERETKPGQTSIVAEIRLPNDWADAIREHHGDGQLGMFVKRAVRADLDPRGNLTEPLRTRNGYEEIQ